MNIWDELKDPKAIFEGHLNESYDKRTTKKLPSIRLIGTDSMLPAKLKNLVKAKSSFKHWLL